MSTNADTPKLDRFIAEQGGSLDGLSLENTEDLEFKLLKASSLRNRGVEKRADTLEAEVAAATEPSPADGSDRRAREIQLPEGMSIDEAEAAIRRHASRSDTMSQVPQTLDGAAGRSDTSSGGSTAASRLSLGDRDTLARKRRKAASFRARGCDARADTLESEICDLAGVDDVDAVEWDAL